MRWPAPWDELAVNASRVAHEHSLEIGTDLALTCFGESPGLFALATQLTSVHQPLRETGQAAVRLLTDTLDHGQSPANASVLTHLVTGDSCGPMAGTVPRCHLLATRLEVGASERSAATADPVTLYARAAVHRGMRLAR